MTFEDLDELELEPEPVRPPLRQPRSVTSQKVTRSDSWWMTAGPTRFTERAESERQRMSIDRVGRKAPDQIDGKWIKGWRGDM